jgi:hypothetical protein
MLSKATVNLQLGESTGEAVFEPRDLGLVEFDLIQHLGVRHRSVCCRVEMAKS